MQDIGIRSFRRQKKTKYVSIQQNKIMYIYRSITHSLQIWVSTKYSISQLECFFCFYNIYIFASYYCTARTVEATSQQLNVGGCAEDDLSPAESLKRGRPILRTRIDEVGRLLKAKLYGVESSHSRGGAYSKNFPSSYNMRKGLNFSPEK